MATNPIIPKYNSDTTSIASPTTAQIALGEIASNLTSGDLYLRGLTGVVKLSGVKSVNGVFPSTTDNVTLVPSDIGAVSTTALGALSGVATLDGSGKLTASQIPSSLVGAIVYRGVWNATTNSPDIAAAPAKGDFWKISTAGTTSLSGHNVWFVNDVAIYNGTTWDKIDGQDNEALTVAGVAVTTTGNVPLTPADIGAINTNQLGVTGGVATLTTTGLVPYSQLPLATTAQLGIFKVGTNLSITTTGILNASSGYILPYATTADIGGVLSSDDVIVNPLTGEMTLIDTVLRTTDDISGGTY